MKDTIRLIFSGDFAPLVNSDRHDIDPFREIRELISTADEHITNLECPLTTHHKAIIKTGPPLKAEPENINFLKRAGVSIACMANNHIFDYGETGIMDTIKICHKNEIDSIGIVNRKDKQPHWLVKEIKGKKIGFLNYCEHEFSVRDPGLLGAHGYNSIEAFYDITKLRPIVDLLMVIYHGGNEYYPLPSPGIKKIFRYLADLGADAVIGHHTHVYSGYEIYKGKPLVYSLGNFFFPLENEPESWNLGLLCLLNISDKIEMELHPVLNNEEKMSIKLLKEKKLNGIINNIELLSETIENDNILSQRWNEYSEKRRLGYLKQFPCLSFPIRALIKLGLPLSYFMPKKRLCIFKNIINCQSHSDLLKEAIKKELDQ